jgi:predicted Fe-Mo cluster-binding NifX family protein
MARVAFAYWDDRIAPVFDVAQEICLVDVDTGQVVQEVREPLADVVPARKALRLAELGVATLVCGAISRPLHEMVEAYGVEVIPYIAGDLHEVIDAWLNGGLDQDQFIMPGCCGRGRGRGGRYWEVMMRGGKGGGRGGGGGAGRQGGGGWGRRGWSLGAGQPGWARFAGPAAPYSEPPAYQPDPEQERQVLKSQAAALQSQLDQISRRLSELDTESTNE